MTRQGHPVRARGHPAVSALASGIQRSTTRTLGPLAAPALPRTGQRSPRAGASGARALNCACPRPSTSPQDSAMPSPLGIHRCTPRLPSMRLSPLPFPGAGLHRTPTVHPGRESSTATRSTPHLHVCVGEPRAFLTSAPCLQAGGGRSSHPLARRQRDRETMRQRSTQTHASMCDQVFQLGAWPCPLAAGSGKSRCGGTESHTRGLCAFGCAVC